MASTIALAALASAQDHVSFSTQDGGLIYADVYGIGDRGVVLAHGGQFNKESWEKQARELAAHAQFLFQTKQADRVMREILRFLSSRRCAYKVFLVARCACPWFQCDLPVSKSPYRGASLPAVTNTGSISVGMSLRLSSALANSGRRTPSSSNILFAPA